jgi:hypothetical protein
MYSSLPQYRGDRTRYLGDFSDVIDSLSTAGARIVTAVRTPPYYPQPVYPVQGAAYPAAGGYLPESVSLTGLAAIGGALVLGYVLLTRRGRR